MSRSLRRRWHRAVLLGLTSLLAATGGAAGAAADPGMSGTAPESPGRSAGTAVSPAGHHGSRWSPERMRSAVSADLAGVHGRAGAEALASPAGSAPERIRTWSRPAAPLAGRVLRSSGGRPTSSVGRVFFRSADGVDRSCSGSALASRSRRLVLTAAHCVHGGPGSGWVRDWVFVPGYRDGRAPYGVFAAQRMRTLRGWTRHGPTPSGFAADAAVVTTRDGPRGRLVDLVGGNGLRTGGAPGFEAQVVSYPVSHRGAQRPAVCRARTAALPWELQVFHSARGCHMGPGSSGGPWLAGVHGGRGFVRTVTSFGPAGDDSWIAGPVLDGRVGTLVRRADAAASGARPGQESMLLMSP